MGNLSPWARSRRRDALDLSGDLEICCTRIAIGKICCPLESISEDKAIAARDGHSINAYQFAITEQLCLSFDFVPFSIYAVHSGTLQSLSRTFQEDVILVFGGFDNGHFFVIEFECFEIGYKFIFFSWDLGIAFKSLDSYGLILPTIMLQLLVAEGKKLLWVWLGSTASTGRLACGWLYPKTIHLKLLSDKNCS